MRVATGVIAMASNSSSTRSARSLCPSEADDFAFMASDGANEEGPVSGFEKLLESTRDNDQVVLEKRIRSKCRKVPMPERSRGGNPDIASFAPRKRHPFP